MASLCVVRLSKNDPSLAENIRKGTILTEPALVNRHLTEGEQEDVNLDSPLFPPPLYFGGIGWQEDNTLLVNIVNYLLAQGDTCHF